jgi:carbon storage regulator CsrA
MALQAAMLVFSRKTGEKIRVGSDIELVVLGLARGRVKLGFAGPREISIRRGEQADPVCATVAATGENSPCAHSCTPEGDRRLFGPLRAIRIARRA